MPRPADNPPIKRPSPARERLLTTATRVFYKEGVRSVSVDQVIEAASVTRSTFYRHFPSKDHLVAACLAKWDDEIRAGYAGVAAREDDPAQLLRLMMGAIGDELCNPGFRGCPFINAAAEFPDPESLVHQAVLGHRSWFRSMVLDLLTRAGAADPNQAARTMILLRDGAMVGGYLEDAAATRAGLIESVDTVLSIQQTGGGA